MKGSIRDIMARNSSTAPIRNPERFCDIGGRAIRWTHKETIQKAIDNMVKLLEKSEEVPA